MAKPSLKDVLELQVDLVLPGARELAVLMRSRKIRLYLGIDPTSPRLHLGHAVVLRKLRQFQDLGHEVILLVGDFTARIGDPSGRSAERKPLTEQEIAENMKTWRRQAGRVLDLQKTAFKRNGSWLGRLTLAKVLELASRVTVRQLLERDMFQERMKAGKEVWVHEFLYPMLQGYDSVALDVDLEVGGTDQMFNMLVGRDLQRSYKRKEKYVLTIPLLLGPNGQKMSKSAGNSIDLLDAPEDMYGKLMSVRDDLIVHYGELAAGMAGRELEQLKLAARKDPRRAKADMARGTVAFLHGDAKARKAENEFTRVFRDRKLPALVPEMKSPVKPAPLSELLLKAGLAPSRAGARRLISQGAVKLAGRRQTQDVLARPKPGAVLQVGKRRFLRFA